jgi:hypothetical protein
VSRVFYRIIQGPEPTIFDFWSNKELGKLLHNESLRREWESAFSVFDEFDYAIANALKYPNLGTHIARVVVPDDGSVEYAQTTKRRQHFSIYVSAEIGLKLVEGDTIPIETEYDHG